MDNIEKVLREMVESRLRSVYTAIPATVLEFDPETQRATVQIDIKEQIGNSFELVAPLEDVGVGSMRSGGYVITFPVKKGDKVRLTFAHGSIDNWLMDGSSEVADVRMHNVNDSIADNLLIYPLDDTIDNYDNENLVLRNIDNSIYLKVKQDGIDILGDVTIKGNVDIDGALTVTGVIKSLMDVIGKSISLLKHLHGGVASGGAFTGTPK